MRLSPQSSSGFTVLAIALHASWVTLVGVAFFIVPGFKQFYMGLGVELPLAAVFGLKASDWVLVPVVSLLIPWIFMCRMSLS
jgi:type II secretory pathway component PulF